MGRVTVLRALLAIPLLLSVTIRARVVAAPQADDDGWQIPADAGREVNPIAASDKVIAKGKGIFKSKCQHCHGVSGKGDGPDADPKHKPGDLTDSKRASRNPDGVMFYKLWNGRKNPKMPSFKTEMSKEDVWTVIQYAKTLRQ